MQSSRPDPPGQTFQARARSDRLPCSKRNLAELFRAKRGTMESKLRIEIRLGNLTDQNDVEAIVNPTNDYLMLNGTTGGEIRKRGGDAIDRKRRAKARSRSAKPSIPAPASCPFATSFMRR